MNEYPKMLYRGERYTDAQKLGVDVHSGKVQHRLVANENEEEAASQQGFCHLSKLMEVLPVLERKKPGPKPKHVHAA